MNEEKKTELSLEDKREILFEALVEELQVLSNNRKHIETLKGTGDDITIKMRMHIFDKALEAALRVACTNATITKTTDIVDLVKAVPSLEEDICNMLDKILNTGKSIREVRLGY